MNWFTMIEEVYLIVTRKELTKMDVATKKYIHIQIHKYIYHIYMIWYIYDIYTIYIPYVYIIYGVYIYGIYIYVYICTYNVHKSFLPNNLF